MLAEGLLLTSIHGSRKSYRARDRESLERFLMDKDESYRLLEIEDADDSRASMAARTGNSKLVMVRSCPGFPVNSYEPIRCLLNGTEFVIDPQEGTFLFVSDWQHFEIPGNVTVISVENMENFRRVREQRCFFSDYLSSHGLSQKALFVSRYPQSSDLRKWLCSIPNRCVHFGDFDLAGIHIFQSEFLRYIGADRISFLIPDDIKERLRSGSSKRYDDQYGKFKELRSDDSNLQHLIDLINSERKGYDQEGYIG